MTIDITLTFGKHSGKKLSQVPTSYVQWLASISKQGVSEHAQAYLASQAGKMPRFEGHVGYQGQWVSVEEQEEMWREQDAIDAAYEESDCKHRELQESLTVRWTAKSGQKIEVIVWKRDEFEVSIDEREGVVYKGFSPVPARQAALAQAHGIVAMIGRVGITAEQKAAIEAKIVR